MKVSIVESLRDREVACSASDRQGSNFESCVWRTVSSQSSHHSQEVLLAQLSLYVHKGGLKPDSFHFYLTVLDGRAGSGLYQRYRQWTNNKLALAQVLMLAVLSLERPMLGHRLQPWPNIELTLGGYIVCTRRHTL